MPTLNVPGAALSYEVRGAGPMLLLIPGGSGSGGSFTPVVEPLVSRFTVVTYDRRGFSNSKLKGEQDFSKRLQADADDAATLIKHVSSNAPANVFGTSSGGVVTLELLQRHGHLVRMAMIHEPPAMKLLGDEGEKLQAYWVKTREQFFKQGADVALDMFGKTLGDHAEIGAMMKAMKDPSRRANLTFWFEHELGTYTIGDIDAAKIASLSAKIVPTLGQESQGNYLEATTRALAKLVSKDVLLMPGHHLGYRDFPELYAQKMVGVFAPTAKARL